MSFSPEDVRTAPADAGRSGASEASPFLSGGGEMGALMRSKDWSATPLGPPEAWPQSLKAAVELMLNSRFAMFIWWGRALTNLYNDNYRPVLGGKHPDALGQSARDIWAEIWESIGPRTEAVLDSGTATFDEALLLLMERHGYPEETYFTFSYSPIRDEDGKVAGLFCAVAEATLNVIGERRLKLLRDVAARSPEAHTPEQVCAAASACIAGNGHDLPFALLYLPDGDGSRMRLAARAGIDAGDPAAPPIVDLQQADATWPFAKVQATEASLVVEDLAARFERLPTGPWDRPPARAVIAPLAEQGQTSIAGFLVAGLNPYLPYEESYSGFVGLLAGQIAAGIANARAHEEERKRAEALAEIDRAKTAFFSNVSHEFRTPLTLMLGPLEETLGDPALDGRLRERLAMARRNGERMQKLVNALLDFSRIEAGRAQAVFEPVDLAMFTAELASNFRSACERAGLELAVDCPPLAEPVHVDRDMWEKIVLNLVSNAFKFTFDGRIAVRLRARDGRAELLVEDTGVGVPAAEVPRLFERFHRIEGQRGRTYEGSGIGLALVLELVKLHGGTIEATSEVGKGTTFAVSVPFGTAHLPQDRIDAERPLAPTTVLAEAYAEEAMGWLPDTEAQPHQAPEVIERSAISIGGRRARLLLVDDNADMRSYIRHLLDGVCEVEAAADGEAALDSIRDRLPDLVLADVMMPRLDGFGLLRAIRSDPEIADLPVILLSARAGEDSRIEGLEAGASDYLVKPFSGRELYARVEGNLQLAKLRRRTKDALRESEQRSRALFKQAPGFVCILRGPQHVFEFANDSYARLVGRRNLVGMALRDALPEVETQGFLDTLDHVYRSGEPFTGIDVPVQLQRSPEHALEQVFVNFIYQPIRDAEGKVTGIFVEGSDVTERKRAEALHAEQGRLLECIAAGKPFEECLSLLTGSAARLRPGTRASVLLADEARTTFDRAISANIQPGFGEGIHGAPINELMIGTCGTAVFEGRPVTCADVERDECWSKEWRELCLAHGIRACHSTPVLGPEDKVIGSFFLCFDEAREPDDWDLSIGRFGAHIAAVAVERARAEQALRRNAAWSAAQKEAFQAAMNGAPLETSLGILSQFAIEQAGDDRRCAFYIVNAEGTELIHVVGMPETYARAVRGFRIGPDSLACGLAVAKCQPVITRDVVEEPLWEPWLWLAEQHGFRGCWSFPVETEGGKAVGSLAMYFPGPREATSSDRELATALTQTASIILSRHREAEERARSNEALRQSEESLAAELAATQQLQAISMELLREQDEQALYEKILDAAVAIMSSDFASIQMLYPERGELRLLGNRGFDAEAAGFWPSVRADSGSTCGEALRTGQRVVVRDVRSSGFMVGTDDRAAYLRAGILAVQSTPLMSRSGNLLGMISTHWREPHEPVEADLRRLDVLARQAADLIDRKQQEDALRGSEERFRAYVTAGSDVVYRMSADWTEMRHLDGKGFLADTREPSRDWIGKYIHPDDRPRVLEAIGQAIRARSDFELEHRVLRVDGSIGWVSSRAIPLLDASGEIIEWFGAASDVTVRKQHEERQKRLIDELNHRVKNTLASVQSVAMQTLRNTQSAEEGQQALESRLMALANAHDLLTKGHWEGASLHDVVASAMSTYMMDGAERRIEIDGVNMRLLPKAALALTMALHELATNAAKYGALSNGSGRVGVSWKAASAGTPGFEFRWAESGGPPVREPGRRGFGSRMIERGLSQDLGAEIELSFAPSGLVCTIEAPIEEISGV